MSKSPMRNAKKKKNMKFTCNYLIIRKINLNCFEIDKYTCYDKKEHKKLGNYSAPVVGETYATSKMTKLDLSKTHVQYCY